MSTHNDTEPTPWLGPWWIWIFIAFAIVGGAGYLSTQPECSETPCVIEVPAQ